MKLLLTSDLHLDRKPLAACGIVHISALSRGSASKFNVNYCK